MSYPSLIKGLGYDFMLALTFYGLSEVSQLLFNYSK